MQFYYHEVDKGVLILSADGGLDSRNVEEFTSQIDALIEGGVTRIIVDCERLSYVSSAGLATLVRVHKRMRQRGGEVKIANVHGLAAQVLEITRLDRVFEIYPDVDRARLAFRAEDETGRDG